MNVNKKLLLSGILLALAIAGFVAYSNAAATKAQRELVNKLGLLRGAEPSQYDSLIEKILESSPSPEDIVEAIDVGIVVAPSDDRTDLAEGWSEWTLTDQKQVTRPYQLYVPKSVAGGERPTALIVHMHGGVGRPDFGTGKGSLQATGYASILWPELAEKENWIIACPVGRKECAWWTDNGVAHVDAVIRDVRRTVDFPEDSIFAAGFSDGGSGCFYRAMTKPEPFAGFIALNGHPRVASYASKKQIYLPNLAMTRMLVVMTQQDSLYPSKSVLPHLVEAFANNADILMMSYPRMNHQPTYMEEQTAAVLNFIKSNKTIHRDYLRWYAADSTIGRVGREGGLELLEFVDSNEAVELRDSNVMSIPERFRFGTEFFEGTMKVQMYSMNTAAANSGLRQSDILLKFDGKRVPDPATLRELVAYKVSGDPFTCTVKRKDEELKLSGKFPEFVAEPLYFRDRPTGFADCQFVTEGEPSIALTTKNVSRLRIWLPEAMSSLATVPVDHNGESKELAVNQLTTKELLEAYAKEGAQVPRAYVEIK